MTVKMFEYLILISISTFTILIVRILLSFSFDWEGKTLKTVFNHTSKHFKVRSLRVAFSTALFPVFRNVIRHGPDLKRINRMLWMESCYV